MKNLLQVSIIIFLLLISFIKFASCTQEKIRTFYIKWCKRLKKNKNQIKLENMKGAVSFLFCLYLASFMKESNSFVVQPSPWRTPCTYPSSGQTVLRQIFMLPPLSEISLSDRVRKIRTNLQELRDCIEEQIERYVYGDVGRILGSHPPTGFQIINITQLTNFTSEQYLRLSKLWIFIEKLRSDARSYTLIERSDVSNIIDKYDTMISKLRIILCELSNILGDGFSTLRHVNRDIPQHLSADDGQIQQLIRDYTILRDADVYVESLIENIHMFY